MLSIHVHRSLTDQTRYVLSGIIPGAGDVADIALNYYLLCFSDFSLHIDRLVPKACVPGNVNQVFISTSYTPEVPQSTWPVLYKLSSAAIPGPQWHE